MEWVEQSLSDDVVIRRDREALDGILKEDPAELCKRQCRK